MVNLPTLRYTRLQKNKWLSCVNIQSMQELLDSDEYNIRDLRQYIKYDVFTIPKKNGTVRIIENPVEPLKQVQRKINNYLQAVYFFYKHPASYGFCMNVKNDKAPCNIYTHALRHTGCNYLLNADLEDFFHTISIKKTEEIFNDTPFQHDEESINWLCNIITYKDRLPMGAPTSPVLSNLVATKFDNAMNAAALRNRCVYTRYADDMSFSSASPYPETMKEEILQTIYGHGFTANMEKLKEFGKKDIKIITGLEVTDKVKAGNAYWKKVDMLVQQYISLKCLNNHAPTFSVFNQTEELEERINGFLAFAQMLSGEDKDKVTKVQNRLDNMEKELDAYESLTWNDIPYQF